MVDGRSFISEFVIHISVIIHIVPSLALAGIFFLGGEARSTKGELVRGVAAWGVPGADPPERRRSFNFFKKF